MLPLEILGQIIGGSAVAYCIGFDDMHEAVRLRDVARDMQCRGQIPELGAMAMRALDHLHEGAAGQYDLAGNAPTEIAGWWKKFKRKVKKGFKKVVKVSKSIVHNKFVTALYEAAEKAVPPPYSIAFQAADGAVRFASAIQKGVAKAKKLVPHLEAAAHGKITGAQLQAAAIKLGIGPNLALKAGAVAKLQVLADQGDKKAQSALDLARHIAFASAAGSKQGMASAANDVKALELAKKLPGSNAFTVKGARGSYHVLVVPA